MDFLSRIDPDLLSWITDMPDVDTSPFPLSAIAEAARARPLAAPLVQHPTIQIDDHILPTSGVMMRVYRPRRAVDDQTPLPVMVFYHGGGFFAGSVAQYDMVAQRFALDAGIAVVSVEYRKTPEHPFPAGFDDCYDTLVWAAENPLFDANRVVVSGASAGAAIAASVVHKAHDQDGPAIKGQILMIPVIDHRMETPSSHMQTDNRIWNRGLAVKAWQAYLADCDADAPLPPYASPAIRDDLAGLPPAFVSAEGEDILRDEAINYANALMQAGVQTDLHVFARAFHGSFFFMPQEHLSQQHHNAILTALKTFTLTS